MIGNKKPDQVLLTNRVLVEIYIGYHGVMDGTGITLNVPLLSMT